MAMLGSVPLGKGRLWITGSKISHANDTPDQNEGEIEWLQFSVEIVLPRAALNGRPGLRVALRAGECPRDQPRRVMRLPPAGVGRVELVAGRGAPGQRTFERRVACQSGMFSSIATLLKLNRLPEPITAPARIAVSTKIRTSSRNRGSGVTETQDPRGHEGQRADLGNGVLFGQYHRPHGEVSLTMQPALR